MNKNHLTLRERIFYKEYILTGGNATKAYLSVKPNTSTKEVARTLGSRMLKRIEKKIDWPAMLEVAGLGEERLLQELEKGLDAKKFKFYQDEILGEFDDNSTQQRARELLADMLGKRKSQIELSGEIVHKGYVNISPDDWDDPLN